MRKSSISTMWAVGRFARAADFVATITDIGFQAIELNHQVPEEMLREFQSLRESGTAAISSVHAPCPKWQPAGSEHLPELSALDEDERLAAVAIIKRAVDVAVQLHAEAVVVHCGRVEIDFNLERQLRRLYSEGKAGTAEYATARAALQAARARHRDPHLAALLQSAREMTAYANGHGIWLGLENRYHYYEMPLPDEMRLILDEVGDARARYWHDLGHAHVLAELGLVDLADWLPVFRQRTGGLHLHDANGLQDHRVAGRGTIDFQAVMALAPPNALRVCEFDPVASPPEVREGYNKLKQLGLL